MRGWVFRAQDNKSAPGSGHRNFGTAAASKAGVFNLTGPPVAVRATQTFGLPSIRPATAWRFRTSQRLMLLE